MKFFSFFGHIGHAIASPAVAQDAKVVGTVLTAFNPGLGALVELIADAAYNVESKANASGQIPGEAKQKAVKDIVDAAAPTVLQLLGTVGGKPVADPKTVAPALESLIDLVIRFNNDLGVFKHSPRADGVPAYKSTIMPPVTVKVAMPDGAATPKQ